MGQGRWWEVFHDPELNALEQQVDVNNQTLKSSVARFRQARLLFARTAPRVFQRSPLASRLRAIASR